VPRLSKRIKRINELARERAAIARCAPRNLHGSTRGDWAYEVKWDGFRAIVSTEGRFRVRSRRGWDMTSLVPELAALPVFATLDGELCAFGPDGSPDFPLVCERMLMRRRGIAITYVVLDLLSLDGRDLTGAPYSERRSQLESLNLDGTYWQTPETFVDGEALFEAVCAHELEGVVAKRKSSRYRLTTGDGSRSRTGTTGVTSVSGNQRSTVAESAFSFDGGLHADGFSYRLIRTRPPGSAPQGGLVMA
jgi:ATP-dependent DNA ligase